MCVEISPASTRRLYRRSISYPCKRSAPSFSSQQQQHQLSSEEPAYKKTTSSIIRQNPPSSKRRKRTNSHHQQNNNRRRRVTFSTNSSLHIVTNLTLHHKPSLWLTPEQIAHKKRKTELFTYLLKSHRLDRSKFDRNVLLGLEKHLYQEGEEDGGGGVDIGSSTSSSSNEGGGSSSSSRQELFTAVLQEQRRQHTYGIQDVEALALVSREKSQRARDLARMIGILQSL
jgi:hypothetical protein